MKLLADITTKTWLIEEEEGQFPDAVMLSIGFRDNGNLPVTFDNMSFGYSVFDKKLEMLSEQHPSNDIAYIATDQDYIHSSYVGSLAGDKTYTVNVWAENGGEKWEDSFTFSLPKPGNPYPSWTFNEQEGMWEPPIPYPDDDEIYSWNEENQNWEKTNSLL